jgi:hypothetical protein
MRTLKFLLQKEFRQIFRDKGILAVIFYNAHHPIAHLTLGCRL